MAVATGPRYGYRYGWADNDDDWAAADADGGMNRNLELDEMTLWPAVIDSALTAPPGGASNGDCYIVGAGGSGDWAAQDMSFTYYDGAVWKFLAPLEGMSVWHRGLNREMVYVNDGGLHWAFKDKPISFINVNTAPPGSPGAGDTYLVASSLPTGAFTGRPDYLAVWTGCNWWFIAPVAGLQVWNNNTSAFTHYDGAAWV